MTAENPNQFTINPDIQIPIGTVVRRLEWERDRATGFDHTYRTQAINSLLRAQNSFPTDQDGNVFLDAPTITHILTANQEKLVKKMPGFKGCGPVKIGHIQKVLLEIIG